MELMKVPSVLSMDFTFQIIILFFYQSDSADGERQGMRECHLGVRSAGAIDVPSDAPSAPSDRATFEAATQQ